MALLAPAQKGLRVAEYPPNVVKKTVTGTGHGEKRQIAAMVGFLLPKANFDSADEADALAIAICHASHRQRADAGRPQRAPGGGAVIGCLHRLARGFPSPWRGGVRGGGSSRDGSRSAIPLSPYPLPARGEGTQRGERAT